MYDDIINSFKDKLIGTAVDNVVDTGVNNLKDKNTLANTYVWTCINKETHNGNVANLTFINKLGKRQRVPYDRLAQFCQMNYVSNVIVEDGKVKIQGCSLYDLPNFKLNAYGQYDLSAPHDENWVYQKAIPYIQSQERLIQEDFANGCLKTSKSNGIQTNASANISAVAGGIKDVRGTAEAVAITAVTVAGAAAVTGTVVAGKAIFNQLNKKKLIEEQDKICIMLGKASDFIKALTMAKYKTNAMYRNDSNLVTYSNEIEANNETTGKLANELRAYGMNGCIQKMFEVVNSAKARATSAKILDMKLSNANIGFGTLNAYIQNIESSLNELVKLHNETQKLMNNNIYIKQDAERQRLEREKQEIEQRKIVQHMDYIINMWRTMLDQLKSRELNKDTVYDIRTEFLRCNFEKVNNDIHALFTRLIDQDIKIRYSGICNGMNEESVELADNINRVLNSIKNDLKNEINTKLAEAEQILNYLTNANYSSSEKLNKTDQFRICINTVKDKILNIEEDERKIVSDRVKLLEERMVKSKRDIDERTRINEKQLAEYNRFLAVIERRRSEISGAKTSKAILSFIDSFNKNVASTLSYDIKSPDLVNQVNQLANEVRAEFNEKYENKLAEEQQAENDKLQKISDVTQQILDKKLWMESFNVDIVTEQTIEDIKIPSLIDYKNGLTCPDWNSPLYEKYKDMEKRYDELSSLYSSKKRNFRDLLDKEKSATTSFKRDINGIRSKIRKLQKAYEKVYIVNNIEDLKADVDREKLQSTEWLDKEIELLSQEYERKCVELCI